MIGIAAKHVRDRILRGFLVLLPLIITIWLLRVLFGLVSDNVTPWVLYALRASGVEGVDGGILRTLVPAIAVLATLGVVYLIGLIAANLLGRRLLSWVEGAILRVPLVKGIYGSSRQLLDALTVGGKGGFSRVVMVQYPRPGVWTLGFVTNERPTPLEGCGEPAGSEAYFIFLPTTPNPTSGWLALVPSRDVVDLDVSVEEGIKLIVSGGIVTPANLRSRIGVRRPSA